MWGFISGSEMSGNLGGVGGGPEINDGVQSVSVYILGPPSLS